jgi:hypothetical protein
VSMHTRIYHSTERKLEIVGENESEDQRIVILIHMKGTILYFDTSTPTQLLIPGVGVGQYVAQIATVFPDTRGFQSSNRHPAVTAETLSNIWHIGLQTAKKTIQATMQQGACSTVLPLSCHYRTDMFYRKPRLRGCFYIDTVFG